MAIKFGACFHRTSYNRVNLKIILITTILHTPLMNIDSRFRKRTGDFVACLFPNLIHYFARLLGDASGFQLPILCIRKYLRFSSNRFYSLTWIHSGWCVTNARRILILQRTEYPGRTSSYLFIAYHWNWRSKMQKTLAIWSVAHFHLSHRIINFAVISAILNKHTYLFADAWVSRPSAKVWHHWIHSQWQTVFHLPVSEIPGC